MSGRWWRILHLICWPDLKAFPCERKMFPGWLHDRYLRAWWSVCDWHLVVDEVVLNLLEWLGAVKAERGSDARFHIPPFVG